MKNVLKFVLMFMMVLSLGGCTPEPVVPLTPEEKLVIENRTVESLDDLSSAKQLVIKESFVSFGKEYIVYKDDIEIAKVKGEFVNITGDVFELTNIDGDLLAYEKQIKRWGIKFNRCAEIYDRNDNITGYIAEETKSKLFSIGYLFHFYNEDKTELGVSDQVNLSFTKKNKFYNNDEDIIYEVEKELFAMTDEYTLYIKDSSSVDVIQAVFMVCIEDSIKDAQEKKAEDKKKKKSSN